MPAVQKRPVVLIIRDAGAITPPPSGTRPTPFTRPRIPPRIASSPNTPTPSSAPAASTSASPKAPWATAKSATRTSAPAGSSTRIPGGISRQMRRHRRLLHQSRRSNAAIEISLKPTTARSTCMGLCLRRRCSQPDGAFLRLFRALPSATASSKRLRARLHGRPRHAAQTQRPGLHQATWKPRSKESRRRSASPPSIGRYWAMDRDNRWDRVEKSLSRHRRWEMAPTRLQRHRGAHPAATTTSPPATTWSATSSSPPPSSPAATALAHRASPSRTGDSASSSSTSAATARARSLKAFVLDDQFPFAAKDKDRQGLSPTAFPAAPRNSISTT